MTKPFIVTEYGHKQWGIFSLPTDFATTSKKYPVLVFFHGTGQTGTTEGDLTKLSNEGATPYLNILKEKFIYIALQSEYWSANPESAMYIINNDDQIKGRTAEIFFTGFSAGASQVINFVISSPENAKQIKAIIPISSPDFKRASIKNATGVNVWAFATNDGTASQSASQELVKELGGKFTAKPVSHESYSIYNTDYKEDGINIYDWMLSFVNTGIPPTPTTYTVNEGEFYLAGVKYKINKV